MPLPDHIENHPEAARNERYWLRRFAQAIQAGGYEIILPVDCDEWIDEGCVIEREIIEGGTRMKFKYRKRNHQDTEL